MLIIQDLLSALARRLESGPLHMDASQLCRLKVDDLEMTIEQLASRDSLFVYIVVGTISTPDRADTLAELMEANLFHHGTGDGAVFGLDKESNEVLLYRDFFNHQGLDSPGIDTNGFVSACVQMIEVAKAWQGKLCQGNGPSSSMASTFLPSRGLSLNMDDQKK